MHARIAIGTIIFLLSGCATLEPRYERDRLRTGVTSGCPVDPGRVRFASSGTDLGYSQTAPDGEFAPAETTFNAAATTTGGGADFAGDVTVTIAVLPNFAFRSERLAPDEEVPNGAMRLGDVRTHDRELDATKYRAMLCGYAAYDHDQDCLDDAAPVASALLQDLRSQALALQGDLVHDVRCFGRNGRDGYRTWCEGVAYLTGEARLSCPNG